MGRGSNFLSGFKCKVAHIILTIPRSLTNFQTQEDKVRERSVRLPDPVPDGGRPGGHALQRPRLPRRRVEQLSVGRRAGVLQGNLSQRFGKRRLVDKILQQAFRELQSTDIGPCAVLKLPCCQSNPSGTCRALITKPSTQVSKQTLNQMSSKANNWVLYIRTLFYGN